MSTVENVSKPTLSVILIKDPARLLVEEIRRVKWYLSNYTEYHSQGYILRLPPGIDPSIGTSITDKDIEKAVEAVFTTDLPDYLEYVLQFDSFWLRIGDQLQSVATDIYGFAPSGKFEIIPTSYGTGAGQLETDGPVFFRLPKYLTGGFRTIPELIVHEILGHGVTGKIRQGTAIDESNIKCTHQWHKERLMDLLGRTLLTRTGLMSRSNVYMQVKAKENAASDIDPLYYLDYSSPDEKKLRYEGKFSELVKDLNNLLIVRKPNGQ